MKRNLHSFYLSVLFLCFQSTLVFNNINSCWPHLARIVLCCILGCRIKNLDKQWVIMSPLCLHFMFGHITESKKSKKKSSTPEPLWIHSWNLPICCKYVQLHAEKKNSCATFPHDELNTDRWVTVQNSISNVFFCIRRARQTCKYLNKYS